MTPSESEQIDTVANNIITNLGTFECAPTLTEPQQKKLLRLIDTPLSDLLKNPPNGLDKECYAKINELKSAIETMHKKGADLKSRRLVLKLAEELDRLAA